uniref:CSON008844 protein n=1 Tax=Culicoides sonorensis TaxID=179676 RepID=A0A336KDQ8_CULSO
MSQSKKAKSSENPETITKEPEKNEVEQDEMDFFNIMHNINMPAVCLIMNLPPQMLAQIFLYLDKKDRLNCKVVCKHWLSVLMTDIYFKKDRHLYLNHCVLEKGKAPLSVFSKSAYGYSMITLGSDVVLGTDNDDECWCYFGDNITYLDIAPKSCIMTTKYVKMLTAMPNIKILRVHNDGPIYAGLFGRAMETLAEQNIQLNLEELRIKCVNCNPIKNEYFDVFPKIFNISKNLKKILIESIRCRMVAELNKVMEDYPDINVVINLCADSESCQFEAPHDEPDLLDNIKIDQLEFLCRENNPENLLKYLKKYPSISGVAFSSRTWPSPEVQEKLTKLKIDLSRNKNYEGIELFPKLKDLTFEVDRCLNSHSSIFHLGVQKFSIKTSSRFECQPCLRAMLISFPNITELSIKYDYIEKETLSMILQLLALYKNVKKFELTGYDNENKVLHEALKLQPECQVLPIFELNIEFNEITDEVARLLCKKFARIKYLNIKFTKNANRDIALIVRTILNELPNLRHVKFDFKTLNIPGLVIGNIEVDEILKSVIECGKHIKTISFPFMELDANKSKMFFDKLPNLHSLSLNLMIVTRVELDQIHVKECQEKPVCRRNMNVSPPVQRHVSFFDQEHNHVAYMNGRRFRHRDLRDFRQNHRFQIDRMVENVPDNPTNRLRMQNERRMARIRAFRRYIER